MLKPRYSLINRFLLLPAILMATLAAAGFAQNPRQVPPSQRAARSEQLLSEEVRHQLVTLPWYSVYDNLQYQIKGSEVTLQGQVVQPTTKSDAEKRIRDIEGVTKINNNIEILPLSPNDDRIRSAEYSAIFSDPSLQKYSMGSVPPVHIIVKNGHVRLEGVVLNQGDKNLVGVRANSVSGVFSVTNNLRIENSKTQTNKSKTQG